MLIKYSLKQGSGHVLVEILMATAIFAVIASAILGGFVTAREGKVTQQQTLLSKGYLDQAVEAVRSVRERDWNLVSVNGIYHPYLDGSEWKLGDGPETVDGFGRRIETFDVERDVSGNVAEHGIAIDPASKKAVITVSWGSSPNQNIFSSQFLTRYEKNDFFEQTSESDFEDGFFAGTAVQNDDGGEVILGAGGYGNWCKPTQVPLVEVSLDSNGSAAAIWAREGRVYAGTGENSSGKSFVNVQVNDTNPPTAQVEGSFDGYKTNAIYGEGNYAYLATDTNDKEVVIIDTGTNPNTEIGYFNAPENGDGMGVFVQGNVGYVTTGNKLYSFDLSSRNGSRPILDGNGVVITLFGTARKLYIVGNYAYIAIDGYALVEMSIVNISNPSDMSWVGGADVNSGGGKEVYVNPTGTRAYLATNNDSSKPEFFIVNTASKSGFRGSVGSYDAGGMDPLGVAVGTGNKAILVGTGGKEYQVIDISDEAHPKNCGELDTAYSINGVSTVLEQDGDAYAYIVTKEAGKELKIIEGGPGGQYATEGTFESETFDAGSGKTYMFNRVTIEDTVSDDTSLKFQVSSFGDGTQGCSSVTPVYYGPDSTSATFYEEDGPVPFGNLPTPSVNPARCFGYKLFLTTGDKDKTPVFSSIKVNYSP